MNEVVRCRSLGWRFALMLTALASLAGCVSVPQPDAVITGKAFTRKRVFIPPNAVFEAALLDVTNEDEPPVVLGRQRLDPSGAAPFDLAIPYFTEQAKQRGGKYQVRAQVSESDRLLYISPGRNPVLIDSAFRYLEVPLEPWMSGYAVERAGVPLRQTFWRLERIGEGQAPGPSGDEAAPPFIVFQSSRVGSLESSDDSQGEFFGSSGCNRFLGSYSIEGAALQLKMQTMSVRLCLQGGRDEGAILAALGEVTSFMQKSRELVLRDIDGKPKLRFRAEENGLPAYEPWDPPNLPQ